eukprot:3542698-Amphidinium_carterae.1
MQTGGFWLPMPLATPSQIAAPTFGNHHCHCEQKHLKESQSRSVVGWKRTQIIKNMQVCLPAQLCNNSESVSDALGMNRSLARLAVESPAAAVAEMKRISLYTQHLWRDFSHLEQDYQCVSACAVSVPPKMTTELRDPKGQMTRR